MMPAGTLGLAQVGDAVVGAAKFEAENRLQVLALEEDRRAQPGRQPRRVLQRRFAADVIHPARENQPEHLVDGWERWRRR